MVEAHKARSWSLTIAIPTTSNHAAPTVGPHHRSDDDARTRTAIVCSRRRSPRTPPHPWLNSPTGESLHTDGCRSRAPGCTRRSRVSEVRVEGLRGQGGVLQRILHRAWSDDTSRIAITIAEGRPDLGRGLEGLDGIAEGRPDPGRRLEGLDGQGIRRTAKVERNDGVPNINKIAGGRKQALIRRLWRAPTVRVTGRAGTPVPRRPRLAAKDLRTPVGAGPFGPAPTPPSAAAQTTDRRSATTSEHPPALVAGRPATSDSSYHPRPAAASVHPTGGRRHGRNTPPETGLPV
jgi:hypothetical protein